MHAVPLSTLTKLEYSYDYPLNLSLEYMYTCTTFYNLNILLMALYEHLTSYHWPTSTSIRLVSPFPSCIIAICMCSCFAHDIAIT